jgi:hypothetical protein
MGRFEITSRKPSTFEVAINRVVSQTLALYREAVDYYLNVSSSHLRALSSHRDTRAAFQALIEEGAAFFTNDASPTGCRTVLKSGPERTWGNFMLPRPERR